MRRRPLPRPFVRAAPTSAATLVAVAVIGALTGCGGDDEANVATGDEVASDAESGVAPTPPSTPTGSDGGATATTLVEGGVTIDEIPDDPSERAEPTGTIEAGGETWEVAGYAQGLDDGEFVDLGGDFLICEAVNPAFPGDANIIARLDDDLEFSFLIVDDTTTVEFGGGFDPAIAESVDFERVDRTVIGSARFADVGTVEFDITCG